MQIRQGERKLRGTCIRVEFKMFQLDQSIHANPKALWICFTQRREGKGERQENWMIYVIGTFCPQKEDELDNVTV